MKTRLRKSKFNPLVSIVIPVYNGSNYVRDAIDSALAQTYKNIEVIVVNDGSTDNTEKIVKSYGNKIRYYKKENGGVATALNLAIKKAKGEYISWLSHDDLYYPNKVMSQVVALSKIDKNTVIYSDYEHVNADLKLISKVIFKKYRNLKLDYGISLLLNGLIHGCTLLIRKSLYTEFKGFNNNYKTIQDYDLWFDIFRKYPVHYVHLNLVKSREHESQGHKVLTEYTKIEQNVLWDKMINNLCLSEIFRLVDVSVDYFKVDRGEIYRPIRYLDKKNIIKVQDLNEKTKFTVADLSTIFSRLPQMQRRSLLGKIKFLSDNLFDYFDALLNYTWLIFRVASVLITEKRKTVLILEPNKYHGETLASYADYFTQLGYNVHMLIDQVNKYDNPFCRIKNITFTIFYTKMSSTLLRMLLKNMLLNRYEFIFTTTSVTYSNNVALVLNKLMDKRLCNKNITIEHNLANIAQEDKYNLIKNNQLFTLWPRKIDDDTSTLMLSPFFFGKIRREKVFNKTIVNFLVVGTLDRDYKNYQLLEDAVRTLVEQKITNFRVSIIGFIPHDIKPPHTLRKYIKFMGRVDFETMYRKIEESDYLISLLDPTLREHLLKYTENLVTYSIYISLGFQVPLVIDKIFASIYKLNSSNAIMYKNNDLLSGMMESIKLGKAKYISKQRNLDKLSIVLRNKSLDNLSYAIKYNTDRLHNR